MLKMVILKISSNPDIARESHAGIHNPISSNPSLGPFFQILTFITYNSKRQAKAFYLWANESWTKNVLHFMGMPVGREQQNFTPPFRKSVRSKTYKENRVNLTTPTSSDHCQKNPYREVLKTSGASFRMGQAVRSLPSRDSGQALRATSGLDGPLQRDDVNQNPYWGWPITKRYEKNVTHLSPLSRLPDFLWCQDSPRQARTCLMRLEERNLYVQQKSQKPVTHRLTS